MPLLIAQYFLNEDVPYNIRKHILLYVSVDIEQTRYFYYSFMFSERIATRDELRLNENIAMVIFGYKTEVRLHLTSDYDIVRQHLGKYQIYHEIL